MLISIKSLNNLNSLRSLCRDVDLTTLDELIYKLGKVIDERKKETRTISINHIEGRNSLEMYVQNYLYDHIK
ncbi:protein of unknown function (plasmid) [Enterobacter cancerogenus]|uniref:H-NS family histone-like protein n=1 Tax=Enterobacter cancerogenus TaxID=69218 RepID=UPI0019287F69|nr:hypothetical protein [Enterobacter cancerogenus]CAD5360608.1 protein of unknown function [Enterobacter cancerogenus]